MEPKTVLRTPAPPLPAELLVPTPPGNPAPPPPPVVQIGALTAIVVPPALPCPGVPVPAGSLAEFAAPPPEPPFFGNVEPIFDPPPPPPLAVIVVRPVPEITVSLPLPPAPAAIVPPAPTVIE